MPHPALLLLPGLLCDARLWRDQAEALADVAAVHVPDLTQDETVDAMARRVLDTAPARFALVGLSMGGYVAQAVLRLAPQRVERLCLMDTSARADAPDQARRRRGLMALVARQPPEHFRGVSARLLPQLVHPDRVADAALAAEIIDMARRVGRDGFLRQQRAILGRPDSRALLPTLRMPTLVAVGEADALTPPEVGREIAELIPGASFSIIDGCGHLPPMERPDAVSAMLRRWLAEPAGSEGSEG